MEYRQMDGCCPFGPSDARAFGIWHALQGRALSISDLSIALSSSLHGLESDRTQRYGGSDSDPDCRWGIRKRSHLGQMPYEFEAGKLKLEAIWGTTALQELDVEQNVRSATTDGAVRL